MMIETLAKIETKWIQAQKRARLNRMWKMIQKFLIAIFLILLNLLLIRLIK